MSKTTIKNKAQAILTEKEAKIVAGNIKKNVTVFDVTGSYEGIDTSDATATVNDLVKDTTAYVNGVKITGTISDQRSDHHTVELDDDNIELINRSSDLQQIEMLANKIDDGSAAENMVINNETIIKGVLRHSAIATAINLQPNVIKRNVTVLGVTGTYEGGNEHSVTLHTSDYVAISLGQLAAAMDAQLSSTDKQKYLNTEGSGYCPAVVVAKGTYTRRNGSQTAVYDNAQIIITISVTNIRAQVCVPDGNIMDSMCNIVQADSCLDYPYPIKVSNFISTFTNYHSMCPITLGSGGVSFEFQAPLSTMDIKGTNLSTTIDTSNYNIFTTL